VEILTEGLLRGLGGLLAGFYSVIPSYGVAIILLTIVARLVLFPLTYRSTRSMQAMTRIQPKIKELQRKYKGNRQKLNEELMKLYKEHQVNPLGGCLPLLLQFPVFIALYAVLTAKVEHAAIPAEGINAEALSGADCRPTSEPAASGTVSDQIECRTDAGVQVYTVAQWRTRDRERPVVTPGAYMAHCLPQNGGDGSPDYFLCRSPNGISHLPADSALRAEIIQGSEPFLGMQLGCSPSAALNDQAFRQCAPPGTQPGGLALIGYFGLMALMVFTTWYQQRQMQRNAVGPQAQQQQMIGRVMPIFLGFVSYSIPVGVLLYWVTSNGWQIGQQTLMLRSRGAQAPEADRTAAAKSKGDGKPASKNQGKTGGTGKTAPKGSSKKAGSRNARGRKKRSKR
jgi:YidC/Oxa1 family membrane protein insertase